MRAIEFETDAKGNVIEIPKKYKSVFSKHVKVILLVPDQQVKKSTYDFSDLAGKLTWKGDVLSTQRELRDEWE